MGYEKRILEVEFYTLANWQERWSLDWKILLLTVIIIECLAHTRPVFRALHPLYQLTFTAMLELSWENLNLYHLHPHFLLSTLT